MVLESSRRDVETEAQKSRRDEEREAESSRRPTERDADCVIEESCGNRSGVSEER